MKRNVPLKTDPDKAREFQERGRRSSAESLKPKRAMKRSQPRRDWDDALEKVRMEGQCRVCGFDNLAYLDAAHTIGREHDEPSQVCIGCRSKRISFGLCMDCFEAGRDPSHVKGSTTLYVDPLRIVPLCNAFTPSRCHPRHDPHTRGVNEEPLDLLPFLTAEEKERALRDLGWDVFAFLYRTTGVRYVPVEEAA